MNTDQSTYGDGIGVIAGAGGLGKTQLAVEYVHRFGKYYPGGVFWIDADQSFETAIQELATAAEIKIDGALTLPKQAETVWRSLTSSPALKLIIYDNFPEDEDLECWLPVSKHVRTLITSRRRDLEFHQIELDYMTNTESLQLLNSGTRRFDQSALPLIRALGGMPLALELARKYLDRRENRTVNDLLQEMARIGAMPLLQLFARKYDSQLPTGHEKEIGATIHLSWALASDLNQKMLMLMSQFAPSPIPRRLLRIGLGMPSQHDFDDPLDEAILETERLSLIDLDEEKDPKLHRLTRGYAQLQAEKNWKEAEHCAIAAVCDDFANIDDDSMFALHSELEKSLPHAVRTLANSEEENLLLLDRVGLYHRFRGRFQSAKEVLTRALTLSISKHKMDDPAVTDRQSRLAIVLRELGEYSEAEKMLHAALDNARGFYGSDAAELAKIESNLALIMHDMRKNVDAKKILVRVLGIEESHFPHDHQNVSSTKSNLALVLKDLGELGEAESLLRDALRSAENAHDSKHPTIALRQQNLALVLLESGKLDEAENLARQAAVSNEDYYGLEHPTVSRSKSNLAVILQTSRKLQEAEVLLREAMTSDEKYYEPSHPSIAIRQSNLARLLKSRGEFHEAEKLFRQSLESTQAKFGENHSHVAQRQSNLGMVLCDLSNYKEAECLLSAALRSAETVHHAGHPTVARRQSNLALALKELGKYDKAIDLLRQSLLAAEASPKTPKTIVNQRRTRLTELENLV